MYITDLIPLHVLISFICSANTEHLLYACLRPQEYNTDQKIDHNLWSLNSGGGDSY